jgi:hypothetical protein
MPNPTQQQFKVTGLRSAEIESIGIYSMIGQKVHYASGPFTDDGIIFTLDGHPSGLYVVRLESKDGRIFTRHLMKQD